MSEDTIVSKERGALVRAVSVDSLLNLDAVRPRQVLGGGLANTAESLVGFSTGKPTDPNGDGSPSDEHREETSVGGGSDGTHSDRPDVAEPKAVLATEVETQTTSWPSTDISLPEMVEYSGQFVEDAYSLSTKFFERLASDQRMAKSTKETLRGYIRPLASLVSRQHDWFTLLYGKASPTDEGPVPTRCDVGVGRTPMSKSRKKGVRFRKEVVPSSDQETETRKDTQSSKKPQSKTRTGKGARAVQETKVSKTTKPQTKQKPGPRDEETQKASRSADSEPWTEVETKSQRRRRQRKKHAGIPKGGEGTKKNTGASEDSARQKRGAGTTPSGKTAPGKSTGTEGHLAKPRLQQKSYALIVRSKETDEQAGSSPDEILKAVAKKINPMRAGIALRGNRAISGGGVLFLANSEKDLEKLEAEMGKRKLAKSLSITRPRCRNPEIIIFGVDPDWSDGTIIHALHSQNRVLSGTTLEIRTRFKGAQGSNAIVSIDPDAVERLAGMRKLNLGWAQVNFKLNRRPLICFKCWRYGHTQKVCRSASCCGRCGVSEHATSACTGEPECPNCKHRNHRRSKGNQLPTDHAAGSDECEVHRVEMERMKHANYG